MSASRKEFLKHLAAGTIGMSSFPGILTHNFNKPGKKLGVALVGLGRYSTGRLAPGLQKTEHCELRGIVTGTPSKIPKWQRKYNIPDKNVYNYQNMYEIANNNDIDVVYIVVPTGLHAIYAITALEAGKHVWCEKPMAMNVQECEAMMSSARKNRQHLSIGYRMQHEPNTQTIIRYGREHTYGTISEIKTGAGYRGSHPEGYWRRKADLGGGALYDMGVYPINAARYATSMEPVAVKGRQWSERKDMFSEVDEFTEFELVFPNGITVKGETSFGKSMNYLDVECTDGWYRLRPFQSYSGVQGVTSNGKKFPPDPNHQQARQMDNEALAILENRPPLVPAEDGLKDIHIVNAIMESSKKGEIEIKL